MTDEKIIALDHRDSSGVCILNVYCVYVLLKLFSFQSEAAAATAAAVNDDEKTNIEGAETNDEPAETEHQDGQAGEE